jgi:hypothetical protein
VNYLFKEKRSKGDYFKPFLQEVGVETVGDINAVLEYVKLLQEDYRKVYIDYIDGEKIIVTAY